MLVTLSPAPLGSPEEEEEEGVCVLVGHCCSCITEEEGEPELVALGLGHPDWEASLELVSRVYPAGTCAVGICLRVQGGLQDEGEARLCDVLVKTTNLRVSGTCVEH